MKRPNINFGSLGGRYSLAWIVALLIILGQTFYVALKLQQCETSYSRERPISVDTRVQAPASLPECPPVEQFTSSSNSSVRFRYSFVPTYPMCGISKTRPPPEPKAEGVVCRYPCSQCRVKAYPRVDFLSLTSETSCVPPVQSISHASDAWDVVVRHQFPQSCEGKKFLTWGHDNHGIGADIHQAGWALAMAMEHDRILVFHPKAKWIYADHKACSAAHHNGVEGADCYFLPISNCTLPSDWESIAVAVPANGQFDPVPVVLTFNYIVNVPRPNLEAWVPKQIRAQFFPQLTDAMMNEWMCNRYMVSEDGPLTLWRAVATQLFLRPNPVFHQSLSRLHDALSTIWEVNMTAPDFCAIAMHVRHGDKFTESPLHGFSEYMQAARRMRLENSWLKSCSNILLSTEDPQVILEAEKIPPVDSDGLAWKFLYTPTPRPTQPMSPMDIATMIGPSRMFTLDFFNLVVTKYASGFVLTLSSNWSRMINYMRLIDGRQNFPMVDLEYGSW